MRRPKNMDRKFWSCWFLGIL